MTSKVFLAIRVPADTYGCIDTGIPVAEIPYCQWPGSAVLTSEFVPPFTDRAFAPVNWLPLTSAFHWFDTPNPNTCPSSWVATV